MFAEPTGLVRNGFTNEKGWFVEPIELDREILFFGNRREDDRFQIHDASVHDFYHASFDGL
mgnify:FL=1